MDNPKPNQVIQYRGCSKDHVKTSDFTVFLASFDIIIILQLVSVFRLIYATASYCEVVIVMNHPLHTAQKTAAFKMSGSIYTLTTLELHVSELALISAQLNEMTRKAPNFFDQTPVILSFDRLNRSDCVDLQGLRHLLYQHGMMLIAIRGGTKKCQQDATLSGIAWLPSPKQASTHKSDNVVMMNPIDEPELIDSGNHPSEHPIHKTQFIDQPVRSGQQIYTPGDLVVCSSVSSGAELLAGGSIHVYGSLRGRALAGVNGDINARIFCLQFEAELISISGRYKIPTAAAPNNSYWGESVQIHLETKSLHIQKL